jgi:hypothetical protein
MVPRNPIESEISILRSSRFLLGRGNETVEQFATAVAEQSMGSRV